MSLVSITVQSTTIQALHLFKILSKQARITGKPDKNFDKNGPGLLLRTLRYVKIASNANILLLPREKVIYLGGPAKLC